MFVEHCGKLYCDIWSCMKNSEECGICDEELTCDECVVYKKCTYCNDNTTRYCVKCANIDLVCKMCAKQVCYQCGDWSGSVDLHSDKWANDTWFHLSE